MGMISTRLRTKSTSFFGPFASPSPLSSHFLLFARRAAPSASDDHLYPSGIALPRRLLSASPNFHIPNRTPNRKLRSNFRANQSESQIRGSPRNSPSRNSLNNALWCIIGLLKKPDIGKGGETMTKDETEEALERVGERAR